MSKNKGAATLNLQPLEIIGAEGQNRTADTGIFSPLLYRLSYLGLNHTASYQAVSCIKGRIFCQDLFTPCPRINIGSNYMLQRLPSQLSGFVGPTS